ncbi:Beta-hexosaminidase subunit beta [Lamellibrachia satsuma]|nr:Beta-hexosaminidase subunit beta [Lamellibrachia satsuma]
MRSLRKCGVVLLLLCVLHSCATSDDARRRVARIDHGVDGWQRLNVSEYKRLVVDQRRVAAKESNVQSYDEAPSRGANVKSAQDRVHPKRFRRPRFVIPTAPPRPSTSFRKDVVWLMDDNVFGLRAAEDQTLKIRMGPSPAAGSPWPMPRIHRPMTLVYQIKAGEFHMHALGATCDVLETAFERAHKNAFIGSAPANSDEVFYSDGRTTVPVIYYLNVTIVKRCDKYPHLNMVESYDLEVKRSGVTIYAREVWGALRGLETFSQLVYQDEAGHFLINKTFISDYPRFAHRGVLIDTARHYISKEVIINNLEAMAQNKFNVFHWHIVDDQSFPYQSKVLPNLTEFGAFNRQTHIYTHEDIAEIVNEARLRGIRVIPEFDSPGHTLSWGYGTDHLLTSCYDYNEKPNGFYGPVNPILKWTYTVMQRLFAEVMELFPDMSIHLGGDEVPYECWTTNPFIKKFMRRNNMEDIKELLNLYEKRLLNIVGEIGKRQKKHVRPIVWQEVYDDSVPVGPDTIVQMWKGSGYDLQAMVEAGQKVIYSTCWYLDYITYGQDWQKYYNCEELTIFKESGSKNTSNLIGGEACMWTEYVNDASLMPRLWPRATAIAERLWSSESVNDMVLAAPRIEEQRCRMQRRGLNVGVLSGPGFCNHIRHTATSAQNWSYFGRLWKLGQRNYETPSYGHLKNKVYVVDMNAMYLVPLVIVVSICCLTLLSVLQDTSRSRITAFFLFRAPSSSKHGVRGLLYVFLLFAFVWCVWTAPIWMNVWEDTRTTRNTQPVS